MAVYTQISKQAMQKIVRQGYGLDIAHVKPVAAGIENSIYQVTDVSGDSYAFIIFEAVSFDLVEAYCQELMILRSSLELSSANAVAVPAGLPLVVASEYKFCLEVIDPATGILKPGVLQPWIAGEHRLPDRKACFELGCFLGVLNNQKPPSNFSAFERGGLTIPVNQHLYRISVVEQALHEYPQEMQVLFHEFKSNCKEVLNVHSNLTYGLVHGDLFADNALLDQQGLTGVIDFFNASWSPRLLDLAICLMDWSVRDHVFHEQLTRALIHGFRQNCELVSEIELAQWPNLVRLSAFRFWCTRQEYYLACRKRGVEPVSNRDPAFCEHIFHQVQSQERLLHQLWLEPLA